MYLKAHMAMIIRSNIKIPYGPIDLWRSQNFQAHKKISHIVCNVMATQNYHSLSVHFMK